MKSKQIILSLSLLLVGVGQLSAMQDQIPIPIYTSEEEYIIIRTPDLIQINCVYDTDNNTLKRARVCQRDNPLRRIITIWSSELRRDG